MVKSICKDVNFLMKKSVEATLLDIQVARDLEDTLLFNKNICVGLAANMIGVNKKIISFYDKDKILTFLNPRIVNKSTKTYIAQEGCLSLEGKKEVLRYESITVEYDDINFIHHIKTFRGFTAEIIQHEIDHFDGILV